MKQPPRQSDQNPGVLAWDLMLDLTDLTPDEAVHQAFHLADRLPTGFALRVTVGATDPWSYDIRVIDGLCRARAAGINLTIQAHLGVARMWGRALRMRPHDFPHRHLAAVPS